jgi:hypothetical protein
MVAASGAGPEPIRHNSLTSRALADAIRYCLTPEAIIAARSISQRMKTESGVKAAVESFHKNLPLAAMQCDLIPDQPAAWVSEEKNNVRNISKLAAAILCDNAKLVHKNLTL